MRKPSLTSHQRSMGSSRRLTRFLLAAVMASIACGSGVASAAVITFETVLTGFLANIFAFPVTEAGFTYSQAAGTLASSPFGNSGRDIEGSTLTVSEQPNNMGGALAIVSSTPGALFTFKGLDASVVSSINPLTGKPDTLPISVFGFRHGSAVAVDVYMLTGNGTGNRNWKPEVAIDLAGKTVDELRIQLPTVFAPFVTEVWASVDNVVLGEVRVIPETESALMLSVGLAGLGIARWRRDRARLRRRLV